MIQQNISFAGAGRVAGVLSRELFRIGFRIDTIVSESKTNGKSLSDSCGASWSSDLVFTDSTDIIIVAVPDHKLKSVLDSIKCSPDTLIVHTAGSVGIDIFPEQIKHKGVFYPLQTFTKGRKIGFNDLPFLIESSDEKSSLILVNMAEALGGKVYFMDIEQRKMIHLAAVFACNFSNHMLTLAKEVTSKAGLSFELLKPLIYETLSKAMDIGPENSQTGPALRNDKNTIENHLELLSSSPDLKSIYIEITESIIKYYNKS
jgi:predicted short-subunit dehydrogenase-like oxidoreductase (DUF2520 family)